MTEELKVITAPKEQVFIQTLVSLPYSFTPPSSQALQKLSTHIKLYKYQGQVIVHQGAQMIQSDLHEA